MTQKFSACNRRKFVALTSTAVLGLLAGAGCQSAAPSRAGKKGAFLFLEAEAFDDLGGWDLDQQSMDQMGSPYLLAHGLGVPVRDAVTRVTFPEAGTYRVWVRTRDWVAPWNAPGTPGKFQLLLDGKPLAETFGTKNAEWHWHDGGTVSVNRKAKVALHDLTGFEGRCEAVLFCRDVDFQPTNDVAALTKFRRALLGLNTPPADGGNFDLVVVGGGLAGTCAAISAARQGISVALVQDRPVLGGNGSSEVRVWPQGKTRVKPYPHVGDIVEEILPPVIGRQWVQSGSEAEKFDDSLKLRVARAEPTLKLFTENRAVDVERSVQRITAVVIQSTRTGRQLRLRGKVFADCTGDAGVGHLAGADAEFSLDEPLMGSTNLFSVLDAKDEKQVLACECKDKSALMTDYEEGRTAQPFPRCPWALDLSDKPFPGRGKFTASKENSLKKFAQQWYWESGFHDDPITNIERIRDHNFRAMYGAWDALKNVDGLYPNHRLGWAAFIAGKRESRRLMGDVVLDAQDFLKRREFPDGAFPCSWHVDLHFPNPKYSAGLKGLEFISDFTRGKEYEYGGAYWAPYRCLYSRNLENLFMAGRNISVSKSGLGAVRVMKTCGMMGEVVGRAAALCVKHATTPRGIYERHLAELKLSLTQPGKHRAA